MFCPKCGKENPEANKFCKNCGKPLPDKTQILSGAATQTYQTPTGLVGQTLDGKYRLDAKIGAGGMGDVYRAVRLLIGDTIAVKFLHAHLASDPQAAERFRREAVTATKLRHRNVVAIFDVGIAQIYNVPYILMEFAEGLTLRQIINQQKILPLEFAVTVIAQTCAALDEAHRLGIVHRDIKPENIMAQQTATGWHIKVLDFGIAKLYNQTDIGLTQDGNSMGTPQYMSPEQCLGESLDGRSDIYSVGIVLFEMLCGAVPFKSPAAAAVAVYQVQNQPPAPRSINPNIAPSIEAVILKCLDKRRENRPPTALQMTQELIQAATLAYKSGYATEPNRAAAPPDVSTAHQISEPPIISGANRAEIESSGWQVTEVLENAAPAKIEIIEIIEPIEPIETKAAKEDLSAITEAKTVAFSDIWKEAVSGKVENRIDAPVKPEAVAPKEDLSLVFEETESLFDEIFPVEKTKTGESAGFTKPDIFSSPEKTASESGFDSPSPISFESPTGENHAPLAELDSALPKTESEIAAKKSDDKLFTPSADSKSGKTFLIVGAVAVCLIFIGGGLIGFGWWFFSQNQTSAQTTEANSSIASNTEIISNASTAAKPDSSNPPTGMVYVAGGDFMMGTDDSADDQKMDAPAHSVAVKPFYIDATETTNEDYKKFVDASGHQTPLDWKNGMFPDGQAKFPVAGIDWDDATAFAKWADKRLPTEEEWE
ncbi:MAG: protein kinase, partial [Pyrinomonadaceae bacterium]|nr:protein kinase [Pyrinomonadaceae bacterium]